MCQNGQVSHDGVSVQPKPLSRKRNAGFRSWNRSSPCLDVSRLAMSNKLVVVTGNMRDFESVGELSLINPWQPI
jgi:hypothetical protein